MRIHPCRLLRKAKFALCFCALFLIVEACSQSSDSTSDAEAIESLIAAGDLSNQRITAFAEDSDGHLWVGTFRGLNKYTSSGYYQYFCTDDSIDLPDNQITALHTDSKGNLWVGTISGAAIYDHRNHFRRIATHDGADIFVSAIFEDPQGQVYIASGNRIFVCRDIPNLTSDDNSSLNISAQYLLKDIPEAPQAMYIGFDRSNFLWIATPRSVSRRAPDDFKQVESIDLPSDVTAVLFDHDADNAFLASRSGLLKMNLRSLKIEPWDAPGLDIPCLQGTFINNIHRYNDRYILFNVLDHGVVAYDTVAEKAYCQTDPNFPFDKPQFHVTHLFNDSQGNLWVGSIDQGIATINKSQRLFNRNATLHDFLSGKSVWALTYDAADNLWTACLYDGLFGYNLTSGRKHIIDISRLPSVDSRPTAVSAIHADSQGRLWLASLFDGLVWRCSSDASGLTPERVYRLNRPHMISEDRNGGIWIGISDNKIAYYDPVSDSFIEREIPGTNPCFVSGIAPADDKIFVTALWRQPMQIDLETKDLTSLQIDPAQWANAVRRSIFIPTDLLYDSYGKLWIGTVGNGLLCYDTADGSLSRIPGTPCSDISAIVEDKLGHIWVSTQYGMAKIDRTTGDAICYYAVDGIGGNQFYDRASAILPDGSIVFGGTHGLTVFSPLDLGVKRNVPLLFEDLKVHNRSVDPLREPQVIALEMAKSPEVNLDHDQNGFSITFSALDYGWAEPPHYSYKLEGHDKYWIDAGTVNEAYYAKLRPGTYTFKVKLNNATNSLVDREIAVKIHVKPPLWMQWWAIVLYVIAAIILAYIIFKYRSILVRNKERARHALLEKEQEKRNNRMNMSFFANISHEFRTPLTMISAPLTQLEKEGELTKGQRRLLAIVRRSVDRMLRLVNQLLDFNKLENDTLRLQVSKADLSATVRDTIDIFGINAAEKGIAVVTSGLDEPCPAVFDIDKIDKIMSNLMSNAVKYTPPGGRISVSLDMERDVAAITVTNTADPVDPEQLSRIFDRYYQLENQSKGSYNWGTGIGLYYSRALAQLHHGNLTADNGEGELIFTLTIPCRESDYSEAEFLPADSATVALRPVTSVEMADDLADDLADDHSLPTVLIVDDDTDVIHYIKALLDREVRTVAAFDADTALKMAADVRPDLIISDVVMPGTTGYKLCRAIKDDLQMCHIPVILVTAKANVDDQVEGLNSGADAYVTKPFDPDYLRALVNSLLSNRQRLHRILSSSTTIVQVADESKEETSEPMLSPIDEAFMQELYALMEAELSNSELDIAKLTEMMRMSRTKLYYKIKALTGQSPAAFFRTYKLNRAAQLILEGKYNVSEIADMTGFSTAAHFSTSFKKQFGVSPANYRSTRS